MKTVMIPSSMSPFIVYVNGKKYTYPAGTEQEVPDEVAVVIEQHQAYFDEKEKIESGEGNQGGGTGGGGGTCKLKLTIDSGNAYGELVLFDSNNTTINFSQTNGTTLEYMIPCGSALVLGCEYPSDAQNLTMINMSVGDGSVRAYKAPTQPGAECSLRVKFDW